MVNQTQTTPITETQSTTKTPMSPTTKKWLRRGAAGVVVVGGVVVAHRYGLLDFFKSKICSNATDDSSVV